MPRLRDPPADLVLKLANAGVKKRATIFNIAAMTMLGRSQDCSTASRHARVASVSRLDDRYDTPTSVDGLASYGRDAGLLGGTQESRNACMKPPYIVLEPSQHKIAAGRRGQSQLDLLADEQVFVMEYLVVDQLE